MIITGPRLAPFFVGAQTLLEGAHGGLTPRRLPAWVAAQHGDAMFDMVGRTAAGVRLRVRSTAGFTIDVATTTIQTPGNPPRPGALVWYSGGERHTADLGSGQVIELDEAWRPTGQQDAEPVRVPIPTGGPVEIWLPHDRSVEVVGLRGTTDVVPEPDSRPVWVHYGSSISHGLEAPAADLTWPAQVARAQEWSLHNLSFSGNAKLDPALARIIAGGPADLITLKVGINIVVSDDMRARILRPLWHGFLDTIRAAHERTPIVVITALACPALEHTPGPLVTTEHPARPARREVEADEGALTLEGTRGIAREVLASRADPHLHLLEGTDLFGPADAHLLYDGLHPSPAGLDLIASRFLTAFPGTPLGRQGSLGRVK